MWNSGRPPMTSRGRRSEVRLRGSAAVLFVAAGVLAYAQAPASEFARIATEGLKQSGAPGMSIAIVTDNRIAWAEGFGLADVENDVPARANTVYRIASISKPIAATAVMQLVERGRVSLDDPIQKYVPAFPAKGEQKVTLRHLMTHTSGIRHYRDGEMESRDRYQTVADALRIFKDDPLLFTPGTKYSYSTYAYNLLAGVVETASGLTFEEYLKANIWTPAGMTATYFDHVDALIPKRAEQYVRAGSSWRNAPYADLSNKWAGGGILSTAEDLARFHIALDQGKLLKASTLAEMYTPYRLADGSDSTYGLGWNVSKDDSGRMWVAHSGGATGGTTYLLRDPARKLAVAILCNVQNAPGLRALAIRLADEAAKATKTTTSQQSSAARSVRQDSGR
jgi:serine beta-lactamase-like protein LACTB, mitochondrial